jgi:hypothetical protein
MASTPPASASAAGRGRFLSPCRRAWRRPCPPTGHAPGGSCARGGTPVPRPLLGGPPPAGIGGGYAGRRGSGRRGVASRGGKGARPGGGRASAGPWRRRRAGRACGRHCGRRVTVSPLEREAEHVAGRTRPAACCVVGALAPTRAARGTGSASGAASGSWSTEACPSGGLARDGRWRASPATTAAMSRAGAASNPERPNVAATPTPATASSRALARRNRGVRPARRPRRRPERPRRRRPLDAPRRRRPPAGRGTPSARVSGRRTPPWPSASAGTSRGRSARSSRATCS